MKKKKKEREGRKRDRSGAKAHTIGRFHLRKVQTTSPSTHNENQWNAWGSRSRFAPARRDREAKRENKQDREQKRQREKENKIERESARASTHRLYTQKPTKMLIV